MKKSIFIGVISLLILALFAGFFAFNSAQASPKDIPAGKIVIANRGSGDISVLHARTGELLMTVPLPQYQGDNFPEPMYVVYTTVGNQVFVGDRANDRVVSFDADSFSVVGTAPTGSGVWHMWADPDGKQLWVNADIDNVTTVIDPGSLSVITTIPTPADLVAMGGHPHDVIVGPFGKLAYVSIVGLGGSSDYVVQFSTESFKEIGRAAVGKDPHLSLTRRNHKDLYVPAQGGNAVYILDRYSMTEKKVLEIPGAHGAGMTTKGKFFYTTNLPGGGQNGLFAIDTSSNNIVGEPVDTPYPVPHNIAFNLFSDTLFLTHSGAAAGKVTYYKVSSSDPTPVFVGEVTVGLNPFGLSFVP